MNATTNTDAISQREAPNGRPAPSRAVLRLQPIADLKRRATAPTQTKKLLQFARNRPTLRP